MLIQLENRALCCALLEAFGALRDFGTVPSVADAKGVCELGVLL